MKLSKKSVGKQRIGGINVNRAVRRATKGMRKWKGMPSDLTPRPKGFGPEHLGLKRAKY